MIVQLYTRTLYTNQQYASKDRAQSTCPGRRSKKWPLSSRLPTLMAKFYGIITILLRWVQTYLRWIILNKIQVRCKSVAVKTTTTYKSSWSLRVLVCEGAVTLPLPLTCFLPWPLPWLAGQGKVAINAMAQAPLLWWECQPLLWCTRLPSRHCANSEISPRGSPITASGQPWL